MLNETIRESPKPFVVANVVLDGRVGGPQRRIVMVGEKLRAQGWDTLLVFPPMGEELPRFLKARGFAYATLPLSRIRLRNPVFNLLRYEVRLPFEVAKLIALFRDRHVDLVHANGIFSLQVALAARLSGRPLVWHFNDMSLPRQVCRFLRGAFGDLASVRAHDGLRVRQHYGDREGPRTAILYPPVDLERFRPEAVREGIEAEIPALAHQGDELIVLAAGHLNPLKGYTYLIDAFGSLLALEAPWRLVVVGAPLDTNPDYFEALKRKVRDLGLEDRIEFVGATDRMAEAMAACDIFVLSSVAESGPMVLLEALAMGKPVVTTDVGIVDEVLDDGVNGLVVPPRNSAALADALRRIILDRNLRDALAVCARGSIDERFSLDAAARAHAGLYERLLDRGRG